MLAGVTAMRRDGAAPLLASDLAFGLGPRINATGRLDDAMEAVRFLLADSWQEAIDRGATLTRMNQARKVIEQRLQEEGFGKARELVANGRSGLVLHFPDGHAGAAGLTFSADEFDRFAALFDDVVKAQLSAEALGPKRYVDAERSPEQIDLDLVDGLAALEPFGREFEPPLFSATFVATDARAMGQDGTHWRLSLLPNLEAVWFHAGSDCPVDLDVPVRLLFRPEANWWNGRRRLQLIVEGLEA